MRKTETEMENINVKTEQKQQNSDEQYYNSLRLVVGLTVLNRNGEIITDSGLADTPIGKRIKVCGEIPNGQGNIADIEVVCDILPMNPDPEELVITCRSWTYPHMSIKTGHNLLYADADALFVKKTIDGWLEKITG